MTLHNGSTAMATVVVDELVRGGVRHVVLAPGSRSAPLAFAAHAAAKVDRLQLHTRIDERSAGFLALGIARSSHKPVAVITTSGTAVANLHPAVLEASHAGLSLVLVTADRPAALRGTNANQTTDQVKIFGDTVRLSADVPPAAPGSQTAENTQVHAWRALVARAVLTTRGRGALPTGPVHLNLQFAEPLIPTVERGWTDIVEGRPDGRAWTWAPKVEPRPAEQIETGQRTVVVAGDDAGPPARVLAESAEWPLFAEPTSGSRTGSHAIRSYRLLLGDPALAGRIERVVIYGHPTLSRPVTRLIGREDVEIIAVPGKDGVWTDPGRQVGRVVPGLEVSGRTDKTWLQEWLSRDADLSARIDEFLASQPELTPQEVAGAVAAALPPRGLLFVGASNPIRDLDLMVPRYNVGDRRMVVANRGLSGIDGSVSSAIGAVIGRPHTSRALALLGDVTFLHDSNGLVLGPEEQRPDLVLVVVNDDGGSIFASLEQGAPMFAASFEKLFGTPHHVDLSALCAATGTPHRRVTTLASLEAALDSPQGGLEVVEAVVRRDNRRELDGEIRALVTG